MEDIEIENKEGKTTVNATHIISKYRCKKDRINFCFEKNWYHPDEIGFDANFFLKVIMGEKKYLPNNFTVNYKLHYFRKGEKLDKNYIIEKMKLNPTYAEYTPDIKDPKKFSKEFLLLLIAYIDPNLYREIYSINKRQLSERIFNKWGDYKIDVKNDLINDIEQFTPINSQKNSRGGFRTTKNHIPTGTFYKFRNINEGNNINQNNNIHFQQKISQLERINQETSQKNQQLLMENKSLLLQLQDMGKFIRKDDGKKQEYINAIITSNDKKKIEEMNSIKGNDQIANSGNKIIKIKLNDMPGKNKK